MLGVLSHFFDLKPNLALAPSKASLLVRRFPRVFFFPFFILARTIRMLLYLARTTPVVLAIDA